MGSIYYIILHKEKPILACKIRVLPKLSLRHSGKAWFGRSHYIVIVWVATSKTKVGVEGIRRWGGLALRSFF